MPFLEFPGQAAYTLSDLFRPVIPVRFTDPVSGRWILAGGLVDSGADASLVTLDTLRLLGFEPEALSTRSTYGTAGEVKLYEVDLLMRVCGVEFPARVIAPDVEGLGYNLLGRDPLFRHVHFAFEEYAEPWRNRVLWKLP